MIDNMYKEENLVVMLSNYDEIYPKIVPFFDVKEKFEENYWIDFQKGKWGCNVYGGSWVDCDIGSGYGYINRMSDCPEIFGIFDKTNISHLNALAFMARNAEEKHYTD